MTAILICGQAADGTQIPILVDANGVIQTTTE